MIRPGLMAMGVLLLSCGDPDRIVPRETPDTGLRWQCYDPQHPEILGTCCIGIHDMRSDCFTWYVDAGSSQKEKPETFLRDAQ